jgi:hypothetical protein
MKKVFFLVLAVISIFAELNKMKGVFFNMAFLKNEEGFVLRHCVTACTRRRNNEKT